MKRSVWDIHPPFTGGEDSQPVNPFTAALRSFFSHFDLFQIIPAALLVTTGLLFIYSTGQQAGYGADFFWKRQMIYFTFGLCAWLALTFFDYRWLGPGCALFYPAALMLLVLVFFSGVSRNGAHRWLYFGGISFQPSEFAKLAVILSVSWLLSFKKADINKFLWAGIVLFLVAVPFYLIYKEPDLGTALVLLPVTGAIVFVANLKLRYIVVLLLAVVVAAPVTYHYMRPYQKERVRTFLDPERDPRNRGWNAIQAELTVGSGGFSGKGFMNGTHCMLGYLPRTVANSDFIFPVISEETGFLGSLSLLLLYACLLFSILRTALVAPDPFGRYLCVGIGMLLTVHTTVNIGMCIRLLPITGLPLPLISYGGSFLFVTMIYLGIAQSVYAHRKRESFLNV